MNQNKQIATQILIHIKSRVPKTCSYLSFYKNSKGEHHIRAVYKHSGKKEEALYTIPQDFVFNKADFEYIEELITEKCKQYVN